MSKEYQITTGTLPNGTCWTTPQAYADLLSQFLTVFVDENYRFFNFGSSTPSVDDQDKPWLQTDSAGKPTNISVYYNGGWTNYGVTPEGGIILWSGSIATIPTGWVICDGTNSTPDLRDRFVVGAGSTYAVDATGGASTLTAHTHSLTPATNASLSFGTGGGDAVVQQTTTGTSSSVTQLPPYYALCYIMYSP